MNHARPPPDSVIRSIPIKSRLLPQTAHGGLPALRTLFRWVNRVSCVVLCCVMLCLVKLRSGSTLDPFRIQCGTSLFAETNAACPGQFPIRRLFRRLKVVNHVLEQLVNHVLLDTLLVPTSRMGCPFRQSVPRPARKRWRLWSGATTEGGRWLQRFRKTTNLGKKNRQWERCSHCLSFSCSSN